MPNQDPITEENDSPEDPELARARAKSRSPQIPRKPSQHMNGTSTAPVDTKSKSKPSRRKPDPIPIKQPEDEDVANAHLSPASAAMGLGREYWRQLSRSPSPLGLIPIHREWRTFIHKHEIPRKFLHVSIGFFTLYLYCTGAQTSAIHPPLLAALIPIFTVDFLRMRWP